MPSPFTKDPAATLDYLADWGPWLGYQRITAGVLLAALTRVEDGEDAATVYADIIDGDTIVSSSWTVPAGITQVTATRDDTSARVWLSGGRAGGRYSVTNHITTAGGRINEETIVIDVKDK